MDFFVQISSGHWSGRVDLSGCGGGQKHPQIQIWADVNERSTSQSGNTARLWDPFAAAFEMVENSKKKVIGKLCTVFLQVPLRPAYTEKTGKLHIYV
jgi:hypothetical protein